MRLLHRNDEDTDTMTTREDHRVDDGPVVYHREETHRPTTATTVTQPAHAPASAPMIERIIVERRWGFGDVLAALGGAVLVAIGAIVLVRTSINSTWYEPVVEVLGYDHTPLLGGIELGAGALLVLFASLGLRPLTLLTTVAIAVSAAVVAIEHQEFEEVLAVDRPWAIIIAVAAGMAALLLVLPRRRVIERTTDPDLVAAS